jgi:hypothetical protein
VFTAPRTSWRGSATVAAASGVPDGMVDGDSDPSEAADGDGDEDDEDGESSAGCDDRDVDGDGAVEDWLVLSGASSTAARTSAGGDEDDGAGDGEDEDGDGEPDCSSTSADGTAATGAPSWVHPSPVAGTRPCSPPAVELSAAVLRASSSYGARGADTANAPRVSAVRVRGSSRMRRRRTTIVPSGPRTVAARERRRTRTTATRVQNGGPAGAWCTRNPHDVSNNSG